MYLLVCSTINMHINWLIFNQFIKIYSLDIFLIEKFSRKGLIRSWRAAKTKKRRFWFQFIPFFWYFVQGYPSCFFFKKGLFPHLIFECIFKFNFKTLLGLFTTSITTKVFTNIVTLTTGPTKLNLFSMKVKSQIKIIFWLIPN